MGIHLRLLVDCFAVRRVIGTFGPGLNPVERGETPCCLGIVAAMPRALPVLLLVGALVPSALLAGCGGDDPAPRASSPSPTTPTTDGAATATSRELAAPKLFSKNTVRIDAVDPAAVAAETALAMFPSTARDLRPDAVAIAGADDWRSILLAAPFAAKPLGFPLLLADGRNLPPVSQAALRQLQPSGAKVMNSAQVIRIGTAARPDGMRYRYVTATTPAGLAKAVDRQLTKTRGGKPSGRILIVNSEDPASAAPAAAWAARSGDPILFTGAGTLPPDTKEAIAEHENPRVYVLGSSDVVSSFVIRSLKDIPGTSVYRIQPPNDDGGPADLSIAFAKYSDRDFGWNYREPGHSYVFAPTKDPSSAMAAAALSSGGSYPAMLYVDEPNHVSAALRSYLLDVQPGYNDQVSETETVPNRGWLIGPTPVIELSTQARIDRLLDIVRSDNSATVGEPSDTLNAQEATP